MKLKYCTHNHHELIFLGKSRRNFIRLAILGTGTSLFAGMAGAPQANAAGQAKTLLLSCMDYRLMDEIERYMLRRGLYHNYDHIVLAGASLGAITDKYPSWSRTFWDHLDLSVKLHNIHTVMVMDHRDCGAYRELLGQDYSKNSQKETAEHKTMLARLKNMILKKYPNIEVETLLMNLNGEVEIITVNPEEMTSQS